MSKLVAVKSERRTKIVDTIMHALANDEIYRTMGYDKSESDMKQYMHRYLKDAVHGLLKEFHPNDGKLAMTRKVLSAVNWESDKQTTINNVTVLGAQHRPDFLVKMEGLSFAVEIKRGKSGSNLREGLGQALVYSMAYDFVVYLFIDTDKQKKIRDAYQEAMGKDTKDEGGLFLVNKLWNDFNTRFVVV